MPMTRSMQVEGRPIRVYDGLVALPHIKQLTDAFMGANFVRDEVARADTAQFRHWELNIPLETAPQLAVSEPSRFRLDRHARCVTAKCRRNCGFSDLLPA